MKVELWFDFICPFCYLGEAKFERALAAFEYKGDVELVFRSFQLRMAGEQTEGKDIHQVVADKYRIPYGQAKANNDQIAQAGLAVGLNYDFDRMKLNDTQLAHEIAHYAAKEHKGGVLVKRLLKAYFEEGLDIGDAASLFRLADESGLNMDDLKRQLADGTLKAAVQKDEAEAGGLGIRSIPHFLIDRRYTVSGAQDPEVFLKALRQAWAAREAED